MFCVAVERKRAFVEQTVRLSQAQQQADERDLLTHSGLFGPMFGTTHWPEQFSPHEWRASQIPSDPEQARRGLAVVFYCAFCALRFCRAGLERPGRG